MTKLEYSIRPIHDSEIDMVANMISAGYYDDEFFIWSVGDDDKRHKVVADYYKIYIGATGRVAYVAETPGGEIIGAAVWLPHDTDADVYDEIDRVTGVYSPQFRAVSDWSHDSEPPMGPFYQLVGFVTLRKVRGMGVGGALLKYQLDTLDETGIPTYLEASTPYFGGGVYGRFGYQPVGELMVFADNAVLYPLWRPAGGTCWQEDVRRAGDSIKLGQQPADGRGMPPGHTHELGAEAASSIVEAKIQGFGSNDGSIVRFGKYNWRVLKECSGKTLLLSENVIELRQYHEKFEDVAWDKSTIRKYLNTAFYNTFTAEEQSRIVETKICNSSNPWFGTDGGGGTTDRVFLLSVEEVVKYLGGSGQPGSRGDNAYIDDEFNGARKAVHKSGSPSRWTLRTPGNMPYMAATVTIGGKIAITGDFVNRASTELFNAGICPALWVMK